MAASRWGWRQQLRAVAAALLFVLFDASLVQADDEPRRFLVISAPELSKVVYFILSPKRAKWARPLISNSLKAPIGVAVARDMKKPMGVAFDQTRMHLFVADPVASQVFYFKCMVTPTGRLATDRRQRIAASNVGAKWVALDLAGNLYFTNEELSTIQTVPVAQFLKGNPMPKPLYSGTQVRSISGPAGIATDNFNLFWTNTRVQEDLGPQSVVKGFVTPPEADVSSSTVVVANNALRAKGLCVSGSNVFYTEDGYVYGVKKVGGATAVISDVLKNPRGCASDGDGTVYVADRGGSAVYEFPGNMAEVHPEPMEKVLDFADSYGLVVVTEPQIVEENAAWRGHSPAVLSALLCALLPTMIAAAV